MNTRFSPSTGTSYPLDIDYPNGLPDDLIEVPLTEYEAAMVARAAGNAIDFVGGQLVITPPLPVPFAAQSAPFMAEVRKTRELILGRLPGMWMAAQAAGNTSTSKTIIDARKALLDITTHPDVVAAIEAENFAGLRAAIKNRYKAIVAAVPAEVRTAFNMVDA